jgi:hypothetical protein
MLDGVVRLRVFWIKVSGLTIQDLLIQDSLKVNMNLLKWQVGGH